MSESKDPSGRLFIDSSNEINSKSNEIKITHLNYQNQGSPVGGGPGFISFIFLAKSS